MGMEYRYVRSSVSQCQAGLNPLAKAVANPIMPSEYAHAMGNPPGGLWCAQWQAIYKYPNLQGGYIWDWSGQGILQKDETWIAVGIRAAISEKDAPSDGNFLCNGIVGRPLHPAMAEVK